jgi:hypothetical protein
MPKDVNPAFEQETFGAAGADPTPDQIVINDDPSVRERIADEEWAEVRTCLVDFMEAVRELPLDDTEPGLDPEEVSDDYESMPANINAVDGGSIQSRTMFRMMDDLQRQVMRERPDRQALCGVLQEAVVTLETLGFTLMQEESLSVPLERAGGITGWWKVESTVAETANPDPALLVDQDMPARDNSPAF